MNRKRIIGILLIVVSLVLLYFTVSEIRKTVTLSGFGMGSTAFYALPFPYHGLLVVLAGFVSVAAFLIGLFLISPKRK